MFFAALAPRLYVALAWAREPVWDAHYYDFGARRIAAGLGYSDDLVVQGVPVWHPWSHYPPGLSGFLGGVYALFGAGPRVAPVALALVGALVAVMVQRLAERRLGLARSVVAGLLVASSPELITYAAVVMSEPLASLFPLVALLAFLALDRDRPRGAALLYGALLGVGSLVRPQTLLFAPLAAVLARRRGARAALLSGALATASCFLAIAPWSLRNCRVMDGCTLISSNVGWNLMIGASPRATGRFETIRATDGCPVVTGQVQQDRCWMRAGLRHIEADPARFVGLIPKKWSYLFDHASFPIGYLKEANPERWGSEATQRRARAVLTTGHRLLLLAAPLGLIALPRRGDRRGRVRAVLALTLWGITALSVVTRDETKPYWWLAVVLPVVGLVGGRAGRVPLFASWAVVTLLVTHGLFFGEDRYHVVVTPLLALLAASIGHRVDVAEPEGISAAPRPTRGDSDARRADGAVPEELSAAPPLDDATERC